jgi:hypothetical protein
MLQMAHGINLRAFAALPFRVAAIASILALLCGGTAAQSSRHLYLVTGFPFPFGPLTVGSSLLRVDLTSGSVESIAELVDSTDGLFSVHADHDRRILAISRGEPKDLIVVNMDEPDKPRVLPLSFPGASTVFIPNLIVTPDGKPMLLTYFAADDGLLPLTGIDLTAKDDAKVQSTRPWEDYRFVRTEGFWAPGDAPNGGHIYMYHRNGGLLTRFTRSLKPGNLVEVDMGISIPPTLNPPADSRLTLIVNNDDMLVIEQGNTRGTGPPGPVGTVRLIVNDKKAGTWHVVDFDKGASSIRGLGPWIAVNEGEFIYDRSKSSVSLVPGTRTSPGQEFRQRILNPGERIQDQATLEGALFQQEIYYPGTMHLYDIKSKRKYTIQTGQGDSEILLVDGATVYYRVNDNLYRNTIGKDSLGTAVPIASSADIQLAHWAFLGP